MAIQTFFSIIKNGNSFEESVQKYLIGEQPAEKSFQGHLLLRRDSRPFEHSAKPFSLALRKERANIYLQISFDEIEQAWLKSQWGDSRCNLNRRFNDAVVITVVQHLLSTSVSSTLLASSQQQKTFPPLIYFVMEKPSHFIDARAPDKDDSKRTSSTKIEKNGSRTKRWRKKC